MIAVNDAYCKYLSIIVMALANLLGMVLCALQTFLVAGKTVVVAGYGWCGKGVAMRAKD